MIGMTYESRVLAVLDPERPMKQGLVIALAGMDTQTCIDTLKTLCALGVVTREIGRSGKRGRPAYLYRRRAGQEHAA